MSLIKDTHHLKTLQSQRSVLEVELKTATDLLTEVKTNIETIRGKLETVSRQIQQIEQNSKIPVVTEHAMLRYLERVRGVDLDQLKSEMLTEKNIELIDKLGSCKIPVSEDTYMVVKGRAIISVVKEEKYQGKNNGKKRKKHEFASETDA